MVIAVTQWINCVGGGTFVVTLLSLGLLYRCMAVETIAATNELTIDVKPMELRHVFYLVCLQKLFCLHSDFQSHPCRCAVTALLTLQSGCLDLLPTCVR